jgi:hypothetical protein
MNEQRLRSAILELAMELGPASSICPSDAGAVARALAREGEVDVTQKGAVLDPDASWQAPVRIPSGRDPARDCEVRT